MSAASLRQQVYLSKTTTAGVQNATIGGGHLRRATSKCEQPVSPIPRARDSQRIVKLASPILASRLMLDGRTRITLKVGSPPQAATAQKTTLQQHQLTPPSKQHKRYICLQRPSNKGSVQTPPPKAHWGHMARASSHPAPLWHSDGSLTPEPLQLATRLCSDSDGAALAQWGRDSPRTDTDAVHRGYPKSTEDDALSFSLQRGFKKVTFDSVPVPREGPGSVEVASQHAFTQRGNAVDCADLQPPTACETVLEECSHLPTLHVYFVSGKEVVIEVTHSHTVADVRTEVVQSSGVDRTRFGVALLHEGILVQDQMPQVNFIELLHENPTLNAVIQEHKEWKPQGELQYGGKLVEKIVCAKGLVYVVHFVDGTAENHNGSPLLHSLFVATEHLAMRPMN